MADVELVPMTLEEIRAWSEDQRSRCRTPSEGVRLGRERAEKFASMTQGAGRPMVYGRGKTEKAK